MLAADQATHLVIALLSNAATGEIYSKPIYVLEGDVDANPGGPVTGSLDATPELDRAKRFATWEDAFNFWRQQSTTRPLRADGRPNRPFTVFDVEFVRVRVTEVAP